MTSPKSDQTDGRDLGQAPDNRATPETSEADFTQYLVSSLVGSLVHDFSTPLSYVLSNTNFALTALGEGNTTTESLKRELTEPLQDALVGGEKIRQTLRVVQVLTSKEWSQEKGVDVADVLDAVLHLTAKQLYRRTTVHKKYSDVRKVRVPPARLAYAFYTLLVEAGRLLARDNVRDHSISIALHGSANQVTVELQGIPEAALRPSAAAYLVGLGVPEPLVKGAGSSRILSLVFPAVQQASARDMTMPRQRLVLIDDDNNMLRALRRMLEREFEVFTFCEPRKALDAMASIDPSLILCDIMMPDFSGADFLRALESSPFASRVTFVTGSTSQVGVSEFLMRVRRPYLLKPFDVKDVHSMLSQLSA